MFLKSKINVCKIKIKIFYFLLPTEVVLLETGVVVRKKIEYIVCFFKTRLRHKVRK